LSKSDEDFRKDFDTRIGAEDIEEYYFATKDVLSANNDILSYMTTSGGTAGGALATGRVVLLTANRKHIQYVRAPAIVVRAPVATATISGQSTIICMVLLPDGSAAADEDTKSMKLKLGDMNYVGRSFERSFMVQEVKLNEIYLVTSVKIKVDSKIFFREDAKKAPTMTAGNPFAGGKTMKGRQDDDFFGGMTARGKNAPSQPKVTAVSQEEQIVDEAMSHLVKTEAAEKQGGVGILDLRDCAKNMHQGSSEVEFRQAVDQMEHRVMNVRSYQCHNHPNLEKHYATVDRKETLRSRVMTLRHLL
jgi:hypothetical protein